jgi:hypothetical protein
MGTDLSALHAKDRMTAAQQAQEAMLGRLTQKGVVGNNMGGLEADVAGSASDSLLDRIKGAGDLEGRGIDAALNRATIGSNISGSADSGTLAKQLGGQTVADSADKERESGAGSEFDRTFQLGSAQGEVVRAAMDTAQKEKWDAFNKYIDGIQAKGNITALERMAAAEDMLALMKMPASVAGKSAWASAGGANDWVKKFLESLQSPGGTNTDQGTEGFPDIGR